MLIPKNQAGNKWLKQGQGYANVEAFCLDKPENFLLRGVCSTFLLTEMSC